MVLSVSALNGVKVYNLSAGKTLPQWLDQTKSGNARALRYNDEFRQRLELVQGLDFPTASTNIKVSRDGSFLAACGVYKPQVKVFELSQLSEKFERHLDADIVDFDILSDDYSKLVFLRSDRTVEFHARWGHLHTVRIPKVVDVLFQPCSSRRSDTRLCSSGAVSPIIVARATCWCAAAVPRSTALT